MFSRENLKHSFQHYVMGLVVYTVGLLIYFTNNYYVNLLGKNTKTTLIVLFLMYVVLGLPYYIVKKNKDLRRNHKFLLIDSIKRTCKDGWRWVHKFTEEPDHKPPQIQSEEKIAILFMLVKLFFLPLMLNFFFNNVSALINFKENLAEAVWSAGFFMYVMYPGLIALIFLVDTLWFSFGYTFEFDFLKNRVRSVEPTVFGWAVALICYPPFNSITANYLPWGAEEGFKYGSDAFTLTMMGVVVAFFLVYIWATLSLGAKCSNLTNRGIVSHGAYRWIRHPAYIAKVSAWWVMLIPVLSWKFFFAMAGWTVIYYFRAITEERHLIRDPDYQSYVKKVKYRFIPGVY